MLWFALAVMTGLAVLTALWPLAFRATGAIDESREADFYKAQIAEIDRDVDRGQLPSEEAAPARAEAARRLFAVTTPTPKPSGTLNNTRRRIAAAFIFVSIPVTALGLYGAIGAPGVPDAPIATRKTDANATDGLDAAIAKIEAHLSAHPEDAKGWEVLAPVYMRVGRFDDAVIAYRHLLELRPKDGVVRANLGEALVAVADGVVTAEARATFDQALKDAPGLPMARFYLALALEQDGDLKGAQAAYEALLPEAQGRAPWMIGLRARLAGLKGEMPTTAAAPPGDGGFSPEQSEMIKGMVARLADRLAQGGGTAEEWARLIRAYTVLHDEAKAKEALASARKVLGANADIDALARELGL